MNKTQKGAWVVLVLTAVLLIFSVTIPLAWFSEVLVLRTLHLLFFALTWIVMGLSFIFLRKKQSHSEVDFDERDMLIKRKAASISYVSLWVLLIVASIVPFAITDQRGSIPVSALPPSVFLIFLIVAIINSLAVLVQYGWGSKDGEK